MPHAIPDTAAALLDAHVDWLIERLEGPALRHQVQTHLDAWLADASRIKLKDVVRREMIHETVRKYAVELKLGGILPELVGEVARSLYGRAVRADTRLQELIPDKAFGEMLDKLLELESLREALVREAVKNPLYAALVSELLYGGIRDYVAGGGIVSRLPGSRSALQFGKSVVKRASPELGEQVEARVKAFVKAGARKQLELSERFLLDAFESDAFREAVCEVWDEYKHETVGSFLGHADSLDIEELFVLGYEYWLHLRQTDFFSDMVNAGIDKVLASLGNRSLSGLLEDIGISREMMLEDAMRFVPPVIKTLKRKRLLEPLVRRELAGFYESERCREILAR